MLKSSVIAVLTCLLAACATPHETAVPEVHEPTITIRAPVASLESAKEAAHCIQAAELEDWLLFVGRIVTLSGLELAGERDRVLIQHRERPSNGSRLALGYLLSRPDLLVRDVARSRALLAEIDSGSAYAPSRDLLMRELAMIGEIAELKTQTTHLQSQLDALKAIEADLSENQKDLEEIQQ